MGNKIKFQPKSLKEEIKLLLSDDEKFTNTKKYLNSFILRIFEKSKVSEKESKKLLRKVHEAIPLAARNYIEHYNKEKIDYKFSTYFYWWVLEVIKKIRNKK